MQLYGFGFDVGKELHTMVQFAVGHIHQYDQSQSPQQRVAGITQQESQSTAIFFHEPAAHRFLPRPAPRRSRACVGSARRAASMARRTKAAAPSGSSGAGA